MPVATPRGHLTRIMLAAALDVAVIGGHLALGLAVERATGSDLLSDLLPTAALVGLAAWLAPKVSYRRRDAWWCLTGIGGIWLFLIIGWRLAYLPHRDWAPRDDEKAQARYLQDPAHAGTWLRTDERDPVTA
jgi:hypothetical protein